MGARAAYILESIVIVALAAGLGAAGCASDGDGKPVSYSLTAKQNYDKGLAELKDENHPEAIKYFAFVKQKFPFSKYAVLAELAVADTHFDQGLYIEASDDYRSFSRLHPTHEKVEGGYVAFRVAQCYVKQMPDDWFLVPPAAEKDQSAVRDALRELEDFLDKYPESQHLQAARKERKIVMGRLVDHEVYVARFYLDRDKPRAAILRLEGAIRRYPGSGREPDLLLALGQTRLKMGHPRDARATFRQLVAEHKTAYQARRGTLYLNFIQDRWGAEPPDRTLAAIKAEEAEAKKLEPDREPNG